MLDQLQWLIDTYQEHNEFLPCACKDCFQYHRLEAELLAKFDPLLKTKKAKA